MKKYKSRNSFNSTKKIILISLFSYIFLLGCQPKIESHDHSANENSEWSEPNVNALKLSIRRDKKSISPSKMQRTLPSDELVFHYQELEKVPAMIPSDDIVKSKNEFIGTKTKVLCKDILKNQEYRSNRSFKGAIGFRIQHLLPIEILANGEKIGQVVCDFEFELYLIDHSKKNVNISNLWIDIPKVKNLKNTNDLNVFHEKRKSYPPYLIVARSNEILLGFDYGESGAGALYCNSFYAHFNLKKINESTLSNLIIRKSLEASKKIEIDEIQTCHFFERTESKTKISKPIQVFLGTDLPLEISKPFSINSVANVSVNKEILWSNRIVNNSPFLRFLELNSNISYAKFRLIYLSRENPKFMDFFEMADATSYFEYKINDGPYKVWDSRSKIKLPSHSKLHVRLRVLEPKKFPYKAFCPKVGNRTTKGYYRPEGPKGPFGNHSNYSYHFQGLEMSLLNHQNQKVSKIKISQVYKNSLLNPWPINSLEPHFPRSAGYSQMNFQHHDYFLTFKGRIPVPFNPKRITFRDLSKERIFCNP